MIIIISIIVIMILLFLSLEYVYNEYRKEYNELENRILKNEIELQNEVKEMKRKYKINEQLILWLYDEINRKNIRGGKK